MKQLLILPIHSAADIITNSSSELFVCNTQKTEQDIRDMLGLLSQVVGDDGVGDIRVLSGVKGFMQALDEITDYTDNGFNSLINNFVPYNVLKTIGGYPKFNFDSSYHPKPQVMSWDDFSNERESKKSQALLEIENWIIDNNLENYFGTITLIESRDDNSIPFELFDILESQLNAVRYHLG